MAAGIGQHVISKSLSDQYLKRTNRTFFKPRGLAVRLVKGRALEEMLARGATSSADLAAAHATDGAGFKAASAARKLEIVGGHATTVGLHVPIVRKILHRALPAPPTRAPLAPGADMVDWRLDQLAPAIAEVDRDVPPPQRREAGWLDRVSDAAVRKRLARQAEENDKLERMRAHLAGWQGRQGSGSSYDPPSTPRSPSLHSPPSSRTSSSSSPTTSHSPYQGAGYPLPEQGHDLDPSFGGTKLGRKELKHQRKDADKALKYDRKAAEKDAKEQRKRDEKARKSNKKDGKKADFKVGMADRMEHREGGKLLWLVVVNHDDNGIDDDAAVDQEPTPPPPQVW